MEDPIIDRPDVNFGHIVNKHPTAVEAIVDNMQYVQLLYSCSKLSTLMHMYSRMRSC